MNFNDLYPIIQDTAVVLSTQLSAPMGAAQSTKTFEQSDPESPYIDGDVVRLFLNFLFSTFKKKNCKNLCHRKKKILLKKAFEKCS